MIISASRRTDIPAFYSEWLMNRIREGFCLVPNPFNTNQNSRISLAPEDVDAFVFWSKNPRPMLGVLQELNDQGFIYYFQFTLNDYPHVLEPSVPVVERRVETFLELARVLGPVRVVWRYDPIIITPATNYDYHLKAFEKLVGSLRGATRRVVVSVVDIYRKTDLRMSGLKESGFEIDPDSASSSEMFQLLSHISQVAQAANMVPFSCAEENDFTPAGVRPGSCIDFDLITSLGGQVTKKKDPGQRPVCGCVVSRDIGINDTCLHGCTYCYSTRNDQLARRRHTKHDPKSPVLFGHADDPHPIVAKQLKLF